MLENLSNYKGLLKFEKVNNAAISNYSIIVALLITAKQALVCSEEHQLVLIQHRMLWYLVSLQRCSHTWLIGEALFEWVYFFSPSNPYCIACKLNVIPCLHEQKEDWIELLTKLTDHFISLNFRRCWSWSEFLCPIYTHHIFQNKSTFKCTVFLSLPFSHHFWMTIVTTHL